MLALSCATLLLAAVAIVVSICATRINASLAKGLAEAHVQLSQLQQRIDGSTNTVAIARTQEIIPDLYATTVYSARKVDRSPLAGFFYEEGPHVPR